RGRPRMRPVGPPPMSSCRRRTSWTCTKTSARPCHIRALLLRCARDFFEICVTDCRHQSIDLHHAESGRPIRCMESNAYMPELPYLLQKSVETIVGHTAILTNILPKFLPCNMPIKEAGAFSSPSTISSRYLRRPVRTHSLTSRKKS